jgi:NAD(P)-dependent dehydrogenase (short-subunit alcohol dehydrogenase family)
MEMCRTLAIWTVYLPRSSGRSTRYRFRERRCGEVCPLGKTAEEFIDSIFDINVKGLLFTVQMALPLLPDGASIILNASVVDSKGLSNSVYSATKAAVRSFART